MTVALILSCDPAGDGRRCENGTSRGGWLVDERNGSGLLAPCPRCGRPGRPTGEAEITIRGEVFVVQREHGSSCEGWVLHAIDKRGNGMHPALKPCGECEPGRRAVWEARLLATGNWLENEQAIKIYCEAQLAAGLPLPSAPPNPLWRKVLKLID